jgi:hypothetical protein
MAIRSPLVAYDRIKELVSNGAWTTIQAASDIAAVASRKEHIMRKYSEFFRTLHDEQAPTGNLGRGTHYSILRAVVFNDSQGNPLPEASFADFAVIWDEDHDERVIEAIEKIYFAGLLSNFLMFGERKGIFTAILTGDASHWARQATLDPQLHQITQHLDSQDSWVAQAFWLDYPAKNPLINDIAEKVNLYLKNLMMLWELGLKPAKSQTSTATPITGNSS